MKYEIELTDEQARAISQEWPPHRVPAPIASSEALTALADAIRANPPKPPRMDEPGWGEKVIAGAGGRDGREVWLHSHTTYAFPWQTSDGFVAGWDDLRDPEPWRADA